MLCSIFIKGLSDRESAKIVKMKMHRALLLLVLLSSGERWGGGGSGGEVVGAVGRWWERWGVVESGGERWGGGGQGGSGE